MSTSLPFNDVLKSLLTDLKKLLPSGMLKVGDRFPSFKLKAVTSIDPEASFSEITQEGFPNQWLVIFSWPKDFTFVCPTEISSFGKLNFEFQDRNAQVLGFSTDSEFVHLAWRKAHPDLKELPFPMLSDIKRELSVACGILDPNAGVAQRATFIVDPEGIIRFVSVTDLNVGRNTDEVLRVLDALQIAAETGGLCPCNWQKGEEML